MFVSRTGRAVCLTCRAMSPLRGRVALLGAAALALGLAARASGDASTFEGMRELYREEPLRLEDIYVPEVVPLQDVQLPKGVGDGPIVEVRGYEVVGATLIPPGEVRRILEPFVGPDKSMKDIQEARATLQREFEERGFPTVAVSLPQQTLLDGYVRMEVVEARLRLVTIENPGVDWYSDANVRRATPHLEEGALLRSEDLQEDVARANRPRDRAVTPVLKAGSEPGTVDLELKVDDRIPLHASLEWNNYHTPGTPRQRATARVTYDNLWGYEHQIGASYTFVPSTDGDEFDDVQVLVATYNAPMPWDEDQRAFLYAAWSDTESILPTQTDINSLGKGFTTGARYSIGLPAPDVAEWFGHSVVLGVDYKSVENSLIQGINTIRTPIRYLPWSLAWTGTASGSQGFAALRLGTVFHFEGVVGSKEDFQNNRGGIRDSNTVDGTWRVYQADFNTQLRLPGLLTTLAQGRFVSLPPPTTPFEEDWLLALDVAGQYADEALVSTEQFPLGGRYSVRGYLEGERFGDHGFQMQLELRTRALADFVGGFLGERVQGVFFYDYGEWFLRGTESGEGVLAEGNLQSVGLGLRTWLDDYVRGEAFWGVPLVETENTKRAPRFQFQVRAEF